MRDEKEILNRWRLALGRYAEGPVHFSEGSLPYGEMDQVLEFLYSREYGEEQEIRKDRGGSGDPSSLTVPSWIEKLRRLFPKSTAEIMERHALEKYNMTELLTDPEVLKRMEPNRELLKMVLELKSMMKGPVLEMARGKKGRRRAYKGAGAGDTACAYRPHGSFFGQSGALYAESGYKEDHSDEFKAL